MTGAVTFGVLMCTHNGAGFLEAQLDSISDQSHTPAEIEIHDWGSTDGSVELIEGWLAVGKGGITAGLVRHYRAPGARESFFEALDAFLRRSDVSHVLFCDQDDLWYPQRLARYARKLRERPTDLLFSDVELIGVAGERLAPSLYRSASSPYRDVVSLHSDDLALVNPAVGMTLCISRRLAQLLVEHREAPWAMHDWAAALLCRIYALRSDFVPEVLGAYRQHPGNQRGAPSVRALAERLHRISGRRRQVRRLARWAESLDGSPKQAALRLFRPGRVACVSATLRSTNLRRWYRLVLALAVCLGR